MIRFAQFVYSMLLLGFLLVPLPSSAQRVIVPTPGPTGAITPIVVMPAPPLTNQRIIVYQSPQSPELKVIVVPPLPPSAAHEAPHVHIEHCERTCLNRCSMDGSSCNQLCKRSCE